MTIVKPRKYDRNLESIVQLFQVCQMVPSLNPVTSAHLSLISVSSSNNRRTAGIQTSLSVSKAQSFKPTRLYDLEIIVTYKLVSATIYQVKKLQPF